MFNTNAKQRCARTDSLPEGPKETLGDSLGRSYGKRLLKAISQFFTVGSLGPLSRMRRERQAAMFGQTRASTNPAGYGAQL